MKKDYNILTAQISFHPQKSQFFRDLYKLQNKKISLSIIYLGIRNSLFYKELAQLLQLGHYVMKSPNRSRLLNIGSVCSWPLDSFGRNFCAVFLWTTPTNYEKKVQATYSLLPSLGLLLICNYLFTYISYKSILRDWNYNC